MQEKQLTRARDAINAGRRRLPMIRMDKPYTFEGPQGKAELAQAGTPWTESMRGGEMPGISAFLRVSEEVFHTYFTYGCGWRGLDGDRDNR